MTSEGKYKYLLKGNLVSREQGSTSGRNLLRRILPRQYLPLSEVDVSLLER